MSIVKKAAKYLAYAVDRKTEDVAEESIYICPTPTLKISTPHAYYRCPVEYGVSYKKKYKSKT